MLFKDATFAKDCFSFLHTIKEDADSLGFSVETNHNSHGTGNLFFTYKNHNVLQLAYTIFANEINDNQKFSVYLCTLDHNGSTFPSGKNTLIESKSYFPSRHGIFSNWKNKHLDEYIIPIRVAAKDLGMIEPLSVLTDRNLLSFTNQVAEISIPEDIKNSDDLQRLKSSLSKTTIMRKIVSYARFLLGKDHLKRDEMLGLVKGCLEARREVANDPNCEIINNFAHILLEPNLPDDLKIHVSEIRDAIEKQELLDNKTPDWTANYASPM